MGREAKKEILADSSGRVYAVVFGGTARSDGTLERQEWIARGTYLTVDLSSRIGIDAIPVNSWPFMGKGWFFSGTFTLPKSDKPRTVTFIYFVSTKARGLALRDGKQTYPID